MPQPVNSMIMQELRAIEPCSGLPGCGRMPQLVKYLIMRDLRAFELCMGRFGVRQLDAPEGELAGIRGVQERCSGTVM